MTFEQFAPIFAMLAIQLRERDADEGMALGFFEAMKDIEPEFVAMAAQRFAKGAGLNDRGEAWFPKVPEWRAMAAKIAAERRDAQSALLRKLQSPLCSTCSDTGWIRDLDERVSPCGCRHERHLERVGRRPWPELESRPSDKEEIGRDDAVSVMNGDRRATTFQTV
jgi:hypothetical protein